MKHVYPFSECTCGDVQTHRLWVANKPATAKRLEHEYVSKNSGRHECRTETIITTLEDWSDFSRESIKDTTTQDCEMVDYYKR